MPERWKERERNGGDTYAVDVARVYTIYAKIRTNTVLFSHFLETLENGIHGVGLGLFRAKGLEWNGNACGLTDSISVWFRAMEAQDVVDHPCAARFDPCRPRRSASLLRFARDISRLWSGFEKRMY